MSVKKSISVIFLSLLLLCGCSGENSRDVSGPGGPSEALASFTADIVVLDDYPDCDGAIVEVGTDPVSFIDCGGNAVSETGTRITYTATSIDGGVEMTRAPSGAFSAEYKMTLKTAMGGTSRGFTLVISQLYPDHFDPNTDLIYLPPPALNEPFFNGSYVDDIYCEEYNQFDDLISVFFPTAEGTFPDPYVRLEPYETEPDDVFPARNLIVPGTTIRGYFSFYAKMRYPVHFTEDPDRLPGEAFALVTGCFDLKAVDYQRLR